TFQPRANGPVVARPRRDTDRRRPGRKPDGLPPPARSDRATRRDGEGTAHLAAVCGGDGGDAGGRSLEGLVKGNPAPWFPVFGYVELILCVAWIEWTRRCFRCAPMAHPEGTWMSNKIAADRIKLKRAYEPPAPDDGTRILIDRLWPRGVKK